jgi:hypothetical protein
MSLKVSVQQYLGYKTGICFNVTIPVPEAEELISDPFKIFS